MNDKIFGLSRVASAAFFFALSSATLAQNAGSVTNHALPIGKGPGTTGYGSLGPCTNAFTFIGKGSGTDPACGQLDLTAGVTGILPGANGGTNNGFMAFTGPATSLKTYTLPNTSSTLAALGTSQIWTALQQFPPGDFHLLNSAQTGSMTLNAASAAATNTITFPNGITDFSVTGGTSQVVKQTTAGGAFTVGQEAIADISGWGTGVATALSVNVGTAGSPVVNGGALGTPSSGVATNLTGTASGLTAGNATLAATVTTNANLTGDVTSSGNATTLTNAPVIAKVLAGFTSGAGTITSADSILSAFQKLNGNEALKLVAPTPTRAGDIIYWNGSAWVTVAGNNSGTQILQETSSGVPSWVTSSGTGTVTSVTCGTGLTGGTFTTSGTCALSSPVSVANGGTGDTGTAWTTFTPAVTCGSGSMTTVTALGRYKTVGKSVLVDYDVTTTAIGTCTVSVSLALPPSITAQSNAVLSGREIAVAGIGYQGVLTAAATTFAVAVQAGGATTPTNGSRYIFSGSFESQ